MASEPTRTAESTDEICAPEGLTAAEQCDYWRVLANEQHGVLKALVAWQAESKHAAPLYLLTQANTAIAKAEGRS